MKQHFLIIDTETTQDRLVADFAAVICDRKGKIENQCAVLVAGIFDNADAHPLFYTGDASPVFGKATLPTRYDRYGKMLGTGQRMLASVAAINRWLERAQGKYSPILTAYNLAFDNAACTNTGIDLTMFSERFCLWHAAANKWGSTKAYRQSILENVGFNAPTKHGNMTYHTNAEAMARFIVGPDLPPEPHTALEDIIGYELPILRALVKRAPKKEYLDPPPYNWKDYQVKTNFKPA